MRLPTPPPRILDDRFRPTFGMYAGAIPDVDLDRARVPGRPGPLAGLRLKQWEHWLIVAPELAITLAVVDVALTRLVWVQVIDRRTGDRLEHRREGPFVRARIARSLLDERTEGGASGLSVNIYNHLAAGKHTLVAACRTKGLQDVSLDLRAVCGADNEPIAVVLPVGRGRAMYSHKAALPVGGSVILGDERLVLDPAQCTAILDVHKAHYPRDTWWNWATAVGFDDRGRRIAFNLTRNVVIDPAYRENAVWIDGQLDLIGSASFALEADPWTARTDDGALEVAFDALGERGEDVDYGVMKSKFRQRYGTFRGKVRVGDDDLALTDAFGLFEDHTARW